MQQSFARKTRSGAILVALLAVGGLFLTAIFTPSMHLLPMQFNPFVLVSAVTVAINLGLFLFFISKASRTEERIWLTLYLAVVVIYSAAELMQRLSVTPQAALFWYYAGTPIVILPVAMFLFALAYTNQSERRYPGTVVTLLMAATLLGFFYAYTDLVFIRDVKFAVLMPWGYDFRKAVGPAILFSLLWNDLLIVMALSRLISFRRHTRNLVLRQQSLLFIYAVSLPLATGTLTNIVLPAAGLPNTIPIGPVLAIPAGLLFVYGILRYQLLSVNPTLFSNTVLAIMQEAVVVTDQRFNIVFINDKAKALLGVKAETSKKSSLLDSIEKASLPVFQQAFMGDTAETGTVTIPQVSLKPAHGEALPVRVTSSRLRLDDFQTWVMVLTDIVDELHTRSIIEHEVHVRTEQLNKARAYLVSSIGSLEQGFILVDGKGTIELTNDVANKLFGIATDEANGTSLAEVVKAKQWNANLPKLVEDVFSGKRHKRVEAVSADGSFYQVYVTPVLARDRELGATIVIENVTEQKILDRSKDEFFSIASHELRTPLTAIRGNMGMLKDYFPEAMKDEGLASMVNDTHDASVRLIEIVNDFLDSSRLEQGKMVFDIRPTAVKPVVESAVKDVDFLAKQLKATIKLEGLDVLPNIEADEGRLRQILLHLLSNAVKYGVEGETITISGQAETKVVKIRIADTGKGISAAGQKMLFHKFQQAGDSILTRDNTKGTGLGLYISKLLAEGMHGDVALEQTEEGKGSVFVVTLPRAK